MFPFVKKVYLKPCLSQTAAWAQPGGPASKKERWRNPEHHEWAKGCDGHSGHLPPVQLRLVWNLNLESGLCSGNVIWVTNVCSTFHDADHGSTEAAGKVESPAAAVKIQVIDPGEGGSARVAKCKNIEISETDEMLFLRLCIICTIWVCPHWEARWLGRSGEINGSVGWLVISPPRFLISSSCSARQQFERRVVFF